MLLCLCTDLFPQDQAKDFPDIRALGAAGSDTCEAAVIFVKVKSQRMHSLKP